MVPRFLLSFLLCAAALAQTVDTAAIDALVAKTLNDFQAPGIAVGIIRGDQVVHLKGYGVRKLGASDPITPDTVFAIGSTTKAFTTTAMAMLVDEGKMQWDEPVSKALPGFKLSDPLANELVTLRDLVCHRTGLSRHDSLWSRTGWTSDEILRRIAEVPLTKPFRSAYQYQNIMFLTAGQAVARISGISWEQFVSSRIFTPLGMTSSHLSIQAVQSSGAAAKPHIKRKGQVQETTWKDITNIGPAGSINSSARDLTRWIRFQMAGGVWEGKRLVSEKELRETHSPQMVIREEPPWQELNPETNISVYGLGWRLQDYRGRHLISHGGSIGGFRAHVGFLPKEKIGFVILTNLALTNVVESLRYGLLDILLGTTGRDWNALHLTVIDRLEKEDAKRAEERKSKRVPGTKPSLPLSAYAGEYESPGYGVARIFADTNHLNFEWTLLKLDLEHWHYDTFQSSGNDPDTANFQVTFQIDANGAVENLQMPEQRFRKITTPKK